MNVLFAGPASPTLDYLRQRERVVHVEEAVSAEEASRFDFLVSHGYRHILRSDVLAVVRAVNLHIAFLPWNRGADPNLWSWVKDTPKGVTVHWIDEGIDTGPIIAQREVSLPAEGTLASTYTLLQEAMTELFCEWWPRIAAGEAPREPQPEGGSYHRAADKAAIEHLLTRGWDTPVASLSL